ncbi:MAG: hypothetical protein H0U04_19455 [Rubrobacter sp.]|nr:hypothetical protein [Rubrobacter sp.]
MREGSLPPFGLGFSPRDLVRRTLGRLAGRLRRERRKRTEKSSSLDDRAAAAIREHEQVHAALFERMTRLTEKAERLEEAGTPSESAGNRAGRAREEVEAELAALRAAFVAAAGKRGRKTFDRQVRSRYPGLELPAAGR